MWLTVWKLVNTMSSLFCLYSYVCHHYSHYLYYYNALQEHNVWDWGCMVHHSTAKQLGLLLLLLLLLLVVVVVVMIIIIIIVVAVVVYITRVCMYRDWWMYSTAKQLDYYYYYHYFYDYFYYYHYYYVWLDYKHTSGPIWWQETPSKYHNSTNLCN